MSSSFFIFLLWQNDALLASRHSLWRTKKVVSMTTDKFPDSSENIPDLGISRDGNQYGEGVNFDNRMSLREGDLGQKRDLDSILSERAQRYNDPKLTGCVREPCLLIAVDVKLADRKHKFETEFTLKESLSELSELVGTAGLDVKGVAVQKMSQPSCHTYIGPGKIAEVMNEVNRTGARTLVIDDDLTPKQQRGLEKEFRAYEGGNEVKILDRTAVILEIFAQHASTNEGQLQVELAQLQYRLTRGPNQGGEASPERDSGAGFRGPGESKLETDKRVIRNKIVQLKKEISALGSQRANHRKGRERLGLPIVTLVGYTNSGKSTILNRMTRAGVLAENMLFATLDSTVRKVCLNKTDCGNMDDVCASTSPEQDSIEVGSQGGSIKGQQILLTDTVGFISKIPTDLVVAFRSTLEQLKAADVLVHVCDRSNPMWMKQREVVLAELKAIGCADTPIVELWNKVDCMDDPEEVRQEALNVPVEAELMYTFEAFDKDLPVGETENAIGASEEDQEDEYAPIREGKEPDSSGGDDERAHKTSKWGNTNGKKYVVAASAKSGMGFSNFISTLEDALSLRLRKMKVLIPYDSDDGLIDTIHTLGKVDECHYGSAGTTLVCRVPDSLYSKLLPYREGRKGIRMT